ncbi:MAG: CehA/McbA family metallohydrolase [Balneolales bacterium]
MNKLQLRIFLVLALSLCFSQAYGQQEAGVSILKGPTPIPGGDALDGGDITLQNGRFAVSFAAASRPPWGVARGGILDLAIIDDGRYSSDLASLIDFMPDNWSSWPTTYQEVRVLEEGPDRGVVQVRRDWHDVALETTFTLERGQSTMRIHTEMTNTGQEAFEDILSGYVLWADGGYLYNRPGNADLQAGSAHELLTGWTASYDRDWALVFHAPFAGHTGYGGQDQYQRHTLPPGGTIDFDGWLQVIPRGELSPALDFEVRRRNTGRGTLSGQVRTRGDQLVEDPIIMVNKEGYPYVWAAGKQGRYEFTLPGGEYEIYAMAENYAQSPARDVHISPGESLSLDFNDLEEPGTLAFDITGGPGGEKTDARLEITEGQTSPVRYMGSKTFFTDLEPAGQASFAIAPGDYVFNIGSGQGFTSGPVEAEVTVGPGQTSRLEIALAPAFRPNESGWYSADLHHHSDILDGSTPVRQVLQSQLAAGLDFAFLSDHDSGENLALMDSLASLRDIPFIASMEISPSWGHFNVFPLDAGGTPEVDPSSATAGEIFDAARRAGARVISVNHPYIPYGYFHNLDNGSATGGFDPGFNLVEMNYGRTDARDLERMYAFWDEGLGIYLTAGSDTHDVWEGTTGGMRMYVHIPGEPTVEGFVSRIKSGHAYATSGPLIEPGHLFGSQIRFTPGQQLRLPFRLMSVNKLHSARLISSGGEVLQSVDLQQAGTLTDVIFTVRPQDNSWYSITVEDQAGEYAYSNPIWAVPAEYQEITPNPK